MCTSSRNLCTRYSCAACGCAQFFKPICLACPPSVMLLLETFETLLDFDVCLLFDSHLAEYRDDPNNYTGQYRCPVIRLLCCFLRLTLSRLFRSRFLTNFAHGVV